MKIILNLLFKIRWYCYCYTVLKQNKFKFMNERELTQKVFEYMVKNNKS